jgi:hypothetical protein
MKNQINIINVAGAAVSAGLLVSSYFLPSVSAFSFAKRITIPQIQKMSIPQKQMNLESNKKIVPAISSTSEILTRIHHKKIFQRKITSIDEQKQALKQSEDKCEKVSKSNGCPKNLDYFTMNPRPKQMPEECFSCGNIITCVCLTGKQSK